MNDTGDHAKYVGSEHDRRLFERSFLRAHGPLPPAATCPISWQPSALTPVFYGVRDYGVADGAPTALRVFFPSLDGAVLSAPPLEGCGRYPVILFAHGHCQGDAENYRKWFELPAQLARSGYVVVVPQLLDIGTHPSGENHGAQQTLGDVLLWIRQGWEHRGILLPEPATGVAGHSFGALHAAILAARTEVCAVASLSGVWVDWPDAAGPRPIQQLRVPQLFIWGTDVFSERDAILPDSLWDAIAKPKHRAIFAEGQHWDYLYTRDTPCNRLRGPCRHLGVAAADLVTMFFANYLPPELWPNLPDRVPDNLIPPPLQLTLEQSFYAGGHLVGLKLFDQAAECRVNVEAFLTDSIVPFVRFTPQAVAEKKVRDAGLIPKFSGPTGPGTPWVFTQSPQGGATVPFGSTVAMQLRVGPIP